MAPRTNVILVVSDTLRQDHLGCYGNTGVETPNFDAFARQAARFTQVYPESLPTVPVRRALHTGRRMFPFRNYQAVPWDIVALPGWQPIGREQDTLAENLARSGYHTGFVTDTLPYFAPGYDFHRGFLQWEYIRGQQQDRWRSPFTVPPEQLARHGLTGLKREERYQPVPMHLANTAHVRSVEDTTTARVFSWATEFLEDNVGGQPFFLLVDCFDPHEPWEAPPEYFARYGDPSFDGHHILLPRYGPAAEAGYSEAEVAHAHAHYCGLVSLVDACFGKLLARLEALGLSGRTAVILYGDHGTNFCDNPRGVIGKPTDSMYPGLMRVPCMVRLPGAGRAGQSCDALAYNVDLTATVYDLCGVTPPRPIDGQSLLPLAAGKGSWAPRSHVVSMFAWHVWYKDERTWLIADIDGVPSEMFDAEDDPACQHPLPESEVKARFPQAWGRLLEAAGGEFPDYRWQTFTDALGQTL